MKLTKFNRLTQDEFMLLQGTDKMANMISNKWLADADALDVLVEHAIGQWCSIPHGSEFIVYFDNPYDATILQDLNLTQPEGGVVPDIQSINIVDDFPNT